MTHEQLQKRNFLFLILGGFFLTNAIIGECMGMKAFSLEALLGTQPAQISILGGIKLDFNFMVGVLVWPFVFITTDIINEYFGTKGVKQISFLTVILMFYALLMVNLFTQLPPAPFWSDLYQKQYQVNINQSYGLVFSQTTNIIIGSFTAFLVSQLLDSYIFHLIRKATGTKQIWLRATGSTLVSQLIDSFVVLFVSYYFLGNPAWTLQQVISIALLNYGYKFLVAILLTPVLYSAHSLIDNYLGIEEAKKMVEESIDEN
ncbi:MAG: VUT family protein [Bacteroidetes bacterium]|nr:MAG: VUT family protein [Bacteroidota bacterium]